MKKEVKICALAIVLVLMCTMILQLILPLSVVKAHTDAGDVNKDGVLNTSDVAQLRTAILSNTDLGGTPKLGDINEDGLVDITDLMLLRRAIVDEVKVGTDRSNLQIGDYIDYTPDTTTAYSKDKLAESITGANTNTVDIAQDSLKWQILRKYDDGSMDLIGSSTSQIINFRGAIGYNNGVYVMNDICKSLYSKSSAGIEARSVNINDYEYWLTDEGKAERDTSNGYGNLKQCTGYVPDIFLKTDNNSDSYYTIPHNLEQNWVAFNGKIKSTFYGLGIDETNYGEGYKVLRKSGKSNFIASRCNYCNTESESNAMLGFFTCNTGCYFGYKFMGNLTPFDFEDGDMLRPVVKLPADVAIIASSTASTETGTPHTITYYGNNIPVNNNLKIGDYIDYTPDTATAYSKDKIASSFTGADTAYNLLDITQESLKWRILRKYNDGSMEIIGNSTSQKLMLNGSLGYNNGVYLMNDICKSLYSKSSAGIEARSVNMDDYEYWLTTEGEFARNSYSLANVKVYGIINQFIGSASYKPDIFGKTDNASDSYYSSPTTNTASGGEASDTLSVKHTYYSLDINEINYGEGYKVLTTGNASLRSWIATRATLAHATEAFFSLFCAGDSTRGVNMYTSAGKCGVKYSYDYNQLRPVVTIPADAKITASETASTETGTPHTITQY